MCFAIGRCAAFAAEADRPCANAVLYGTAVRFHTQSCLAPRSLEDSGVQQGSRATSPETERAHRKPIVSSRRAVGQDLASSLVVSFAAGTLPLACFACCCGGPTLSRWPTAGRYIVALF